MILLWLLRGHWGRWEDLMVTGSLAEPYWKEPGVGWEPHQGHLDTPSGGNFPLLGNMRESSWHKSNKLLLCSVLQLQGLLWRYVLERAQLLRSTAKWNRVGKLRRHFNCISEDHRKNIGLWRSREGLWRSVTQGSGTRSTQSFMTFSTCTSKTSESWWVRARLSPFIF